MLLSQDEARFPLVPTLSTTLGVKGHRPLVGTWDNKDQGYCFAALNLVTGQFTTRLLEQPTRSKAKLGRSKQQRLQTAFVAHLQDIARMYPAHLYPDVVLIIDNAPWHRGVGVEQVPDFSVVLFRPHCMLVSEKNRVKAHTNQWLLTMPYPPERLSGATYRGQTMVPEAQKPSQ